MPPILKHSLKSPQPIHLYNLEAAAMIKPAVSIPVIVTGGIRRLTDMENIVGEMGIDFVSLSRPLIKEPLLIKHLREGRSIPLYRLQRMCDRN